MVARSGMTIGVLALTVLSGAALGQSATAPAGSVLESRPATGQPERDTLLKLMRPVTVDFKEHRLEDAVKFITELTGADIETMWIDEQNPTGLDKEKPVTLSVKNVTALKLVEMLMAKTSDDSSSPGGNSWQMSESGAMQIGPKSRLNKFRRIELYDMNDLLLVVPEYSNAPQFDLNSVLQSTGGGQRGGGGGGQSPFQSTNTGGNNTFGGAQLPSREQRADELMTLIKDLVEPEQWIDNGGEGGSMRRFQGAILINAPDYVHRAINGYPYWPSRNPSTTSAAVARRWVTLNGSTSINKIDGFATYPATAVVGGRIIRSDGPQKKGP